MEPIALDLEALADNLKGLKGARYTKAVTYTFALSNMCNVLLNLVSDDVCQTYFLASKEEVGKRLGYLIEQSTVNVAEYEAVARHKGFVTMSLEDRYDIMDKLIHEFMRDINMLQNKQDEHLRRS